MSFFFLPLEPQPSYDFLFKIAAMFTTHPENFHSRVLNILYSQYADWPSCNRVFASFFCK